MTCKHCGATIPADHGLCPACGAHAPQTEASLRYHARIVEGGNTVRNPVTRDPAERIADETVRVAPLRRAARSASRRPTEPAAPEPPAGRSRSKPMTETPYAAPPKAAAPPRMVERYEFQAIRPEAQGYENFNWLRLLVISLISVIILTVGAYFFLTQTFSGQYWLAMLGRDASAEAYHQLGRDRLADGGIVRAIDALEIAQSKNPNNLELLIDLGRAYMGNGQIKEAEIAFTRAIQYWPAYPEPYRRVIDIMLTQGRNYEALKTIELAMSESGADDFTTMYSQLIPPMPSASLPGKRYDAEQDITLSGVEGGTIYYSIANEDPVAKGEIYTGSIHLFEGSYRLRAVVEKDGMYSKELVVSYVVIKPTPDMPYARLKTGTYDKVQYVPLSTTNPADTIYYTVDGTEPTTESKKYEAPIPLRIGKTTIRAIAVNVDNEKSNELRVEYECGGKTAKIMSDKDVIDKLSLFSTTRESFVKTYGEPESEAPDGEDDLGRYTRLRYAFGDAVFLTRGKDKEPVLAELSTRSPDFAGPRKTAVGMRMEDVLAAFRDGGGEAALDGHRVLYNFTTGSLGMIEKTADSMFKISYYTKLENGQFIELSYFIDEGLVVRIDWARYEPD